MNKKVLIVNYEPKSLLKLETLISSAGFDVFTAKDGIKALESVEKSKPDLLIIDPMLPKISGFEVSKKVSEKHPKLPIIIITSVYKGMRYKNEALTKYGANEFFEIPFDEEYFLSRVFELLGVSVKKEKQMQNITNNDKKSSGRKLKDIYNNLIGDVKKTENIKSKKVSKNKINYSDSVDLEVENQLNKTLSELTIGKKISKRQRI